MPQCYAQANFRIAAARRATGCGCSEPLRVVFDPLIHSKALSAPGYTAAAMAYWPSTPAEAVEFARSGSIPLHRAIPYLVRRFAGHELVGTFLLQAARDPHPSDRALALQFLADFPALLDHSLPLLAAALDDPDGNFGGGFDESTTWSALQSLQRLGAAAEALAPQLQRAYRRALSDDPEAVRPMFHTIVAVAGPERAAEFLFHFERQRDATLLPSEIVDTILDLWPLDLAYPAFLRDHPEAPVRAAYQDNLALEREIIADLLRTSETFRANYKPRPELPTT